MPDEIKKQFEKEFDSYGKSKEFFGFNKKINIHFNHQKNFNFKNEDIQVLLLWEPEVFMPEQYRKNIFNKYDLVIPFNEDRAKRLNFDQYLLHPFDFKNHNFKKFENKKFVNLISGKKFSGSKRSMYGLRRKCLVELPKAGINIDLYGPNWNESWTKEFRERIWAIRRCLSARKFPDVLEAFSEIGYVYKNYLGPMGEKVNSLGQYKYSLIIENDLDSITEKIFEAIECLTVPIYVGGSLNNFPDLQMCVVEVEPNVNKIIETFQNLDDKLYEKKIESINNFLEKDNLVKIKFSSEHNWKKLINMIDLYLTNQSYLDIQSS
jgi:hypothetical protein